MAKRSSGDGSEGERGREGEGAKKRIKRHTDLDVYRRAFTAAMRVFELTKSFPAEEKYSLTDQFRRASRSVCYNIAEGWRKRRYERAFVSKLSDSDGEAAETQVCIHFSVECGYLSREIGRELYDTYDAIQAMLVRMINNPKDWVL